MGEFNVDKSTGDLLETAGMPSEYPATQVMLSDGVTSVEDALDGLTDLITTADVNIGSVNIGSAGWTDVSSYKPATPSGYQLLLACVLDYGSAGGGAVNITADGNYLSAQANATVTYLHVRYIFIKETTP